MLILTINNTLPIKNIRTKIVSNSKKKFMNNTRKHTGDDCKTCTSPRWPIVVADCYDRIISNTFVAIGQYQPLLRIKSSLLSHSIINMSKSKYNI